MKKLCYIISCIALIELVIIIFYVRKDHDEYQHNLWNKNLEAEFAVWEEKVDSIIRICDTIDFWSNNEADEDLEFSDSFQIYLAYDFLIDTILQDTPNPSLLIKSGDDFSTDINVSLSESDIDKINELLESSTLLMHYPFVLLIKTFESTGSCVFESDSSTLSTTKNAVLLSLIEIK